MVPEWKEPAGHLNAPRSEGVALVEYRILSKNSSQTVAIKICHLVVIRIGMNKMAEGEEYLDCLDETLEWAAKLGALL